MVNILIHLSLTTHLIILVKFIAKGEISVLKGMNNVKDLGVLQFTFQKA